MRYALQGLARYIATPRVAKHRIFLWLNPDVLANDRTFIFARDDDYFFGILHSRVHEVWALATSSRHGVGNDPTYNNTTCFETSRSRGRRAANPSATRASRPLPRPPANSSSNAMRGLPRIDPKGLQDPSGLTSRAPSPTSTTSVPPGLTWRIANWMRPCSTPTAGRTI